MGRWIVFIVLSIRVIILALTINYFLRFVKKQGKKLQKCPFLSRKWRYFFYFPLGRFDVTRSFVISKDLTVDNPAVVDAKFLVSIINYRKAMTPFIQRLPFGMQV